VFSFVVDFTHQLFPFDFPCHPDCLIEIVLKFLPQNNEVEKPSTCKVVGVWLRLYARIGFYAACKSMVCHIAIRDVIDIFFTVLQGRK
jgi:hypothetical protein